MRTGDEHGLRELQRKAMGTELNPDGGYLVVPEHARSPLSTFLTEWSPMRQIATVRETTRAEFVQPTRTGPAASGWVAEAAPRTTTGTPTLGEDRYRTMELYALPEATQTMLDDSEIDLESWLAEEIAEAFATQEDDAWFNGDGVLKPRGLLTYPFVTDANWAHGSFRYVPTGAAADFPAAPNTGDPLLTLIYTIKSGHRPDASWLMNRSLVSEVRKFKDSTGAYLWQPAVAGASLAGGQPGTLLGYRIHESEKIPDKGANTTAIGFGNWRRTYLIVDRMGVRVQRDPFTNRPFVQFYSTKRVGGGVQYFDAAAFLKFATS
jgi:HK97 family phage major capsid protein